MSHEFIGNPVAKKQISQALDTNGKIMLVGPTGSGKSMLVTTLAREKDMDIIEIHSDSCHTMKQVQDIISSACCNSIEQFFSPRKRLLWIDDADLLSANFIKFPTMLSEFVNMPWAKSLSIIFSTTSTSKLNSKGYTVIKLCRPTVSECVVHFSNYCEKNRINISKEDLNAIIEAHACDMRSIQMNLESTGGGSGDSGDSGGGGGKECGGARTETEEHREFRNADISSLRNAFQDASIFEIQDRLLTKPHRLTDIEDLIFSDAKMTAWTMQENIGVELQCYREASTEHATRIMITVLDSFARAEIIDHAANASMNWDIMPYSYVEMFGPLLHALYDVPRDPTGTRRKERRPFVFTTSLNQSSQRAQLLRKKNEWAEEAELVGDEQQLAGMGRIAAVLSAHASNKKTSEAVESVSTFSKSDFDIGCRFGVDFKVMTASQCSSWKKHRKKYLDAADSD